MLEVPRQRRHRDHLRHRLPERVLERAGVVTDDNGLRRHEAHRQEAGDQQSRD